MPDEVPTRFLHVGNGHSTTSLIARAMIPGTLSIWADALHEGPVPGDFTDEELLNVRAAHLATHGHTREHSDIWHVFPLMHEDEECFYIADRSFWNVFSDLATASPPLIEITVESQVPGRLLRGTLTLTAAGRDVLGGRADRIRLCGIDRWLGGVHLTAASPWRWDPDAGRITNA